MLNDIYNIWYVTMQFINFKWTEYMDYIPITSNTSNTQLCGYVLESVEIVSYERNI